MRTCVSGVQAEAPAEAPPESLAEAPADFGSLTGGLPGTASAVTTWMAPSTLDTDVPGEIHPDSEALPADGEPRLRFDLLLLLPVGKCTITNATCR